MTHQPENEQKKQKKGFRHHARKVHGRITKYLYEKDTIFATLWVFIFIYGLSLIPLNLGIMNPVKLGLKDFDFNDITYSKLGKGKKTPVDNRIVIINIGMADREGLSMLIDKVASFEPKVIGLDVMMEGPREAYKDSLMSATIQKYNNLIVASKFNWKDTTTPYIRSYFAPFVQKEGYVNMLADDIATVRLWAPFFEKSHNKGEKEKPYQSFAATIIEEYDPEAFHYLEIRHKKTEIINYSRRLDKYWRLEGEEVLASNTDDTIIRKLIKGKIALLGYINENPSDIEDKKFTPMNEKFAGKSFPDMNGIVVHANMISMALDKDYIKKVPLWGNLLLAIVVCWLHMSFFIHYYLESHIWFHLAAKIAQVLSALFFVWLGIYLYDKYRLKVDMKMSLIVIVLAVDIIYFYEAWAVWMHKKFNYKTVFKPHHHQ